LSRYIYAGLFGLACIAAFVGEANAQASAPMLTLDDALKRALADDPGVRAADASRIAAEAGVRQAGRFLDPSLDVLRENVEGTGPYTGQRRAETTYSLRQPLELGGDRGARRRVAESDLEVTLALGEIRKLDLMEEVERAYVDAQAAEAGLVIAEEKLTVAQELRAAVERRVREARDPLMAGSRAEARLAEAQLERETARAVATAAHERLASFWGGGAAFSIDRGSFNVLTPNAEGARTAPDVALADAQAARAQAEIGVERARAFPNVDLHGGWRQFSEDRESALVFGFAMPLPIWNGNRAAIARARAEGDRAQFEREARARQAQRQTALLRGQSDTARLEVSTLDARVIPASEQALSRAREGYAQGGFSYLDVLDAQRALADARTRRVTALRNYHYAQASLARLTGARAEEIAR
jgi:cobalt-zinc-cadmium efflux system outer membrane protein